MLSLGHIFADQLDPLSHCHLEIELPVPELAEVTAVLQALAEIQQVVPEEALLVELLYLDHHPTVHIFPQCALAARLAGDQ